MKQNNRHKWHVLIRRVKKSVTATNAEGSESTKSAVMWGLFTQEFIPAGAFVLEYVGEVISARDGDKRGKVYDRLGMSYLFDMNDFDDDDSFDKKHQDKYSDGFFPLCVDATFYGNESRFINHSCEPNLKSYNLVTDVESITYHHIGLFATRNIPAG